MLRIVVEGALAPDGRLPLSELARIAGGLQAELERVARVLAGTDAVRTGRRPSDVVEPTRLDLVGFGAGSAVLEVEPHEQQLALMPSLLEESLSALLDGMAALTADPKALPRGFDRGVVGGLRELTGGLGRAISSIRIERRGHSAAVVIDDRLKQAVRAHLRGGHHESILITGRLHMGDFAPSALRCRIDTSRGAVTCDFDADLRDDVLAAMDQLVTARGEAERWPDSRELRLVHLETVQPVQEAQARSLEDLIAEQGVRPIGTAEELAGQPMDDFDEWLAAVRSLRSG